MTEYLRVVGLDLSLTSTGVAVVRPGGSWVTTLRPPPGVTGYERLAYMLNGVCDFVTRESLVVVEARDFSSREAYASETSGLWWMVTYRLWKNNIGLAKVTTSQIKKYATGKGNAGKDAVLVAAVRRYHEVEIEGTDTAEALLAAMIGAHALGWPGRWPGARNSEVVRDVKWPFEREEVPVG